MWHYVTSRQVSLIDWLTVTGWHHHIMSRWSGERHGLLGFASMSALPQSSINHLSPILDLGKVDMLLQTPAAHGERIIVNQRDPFVSTIWLFCNTCIECWSIYDLLCSIPSIGKQQNLCEWNLAVEFVIWLCLILSYQYTFAVSIIQGIPNSKICVSEILQLSLWFYLLVLLLFHTNLHLQFQKSPVASSVACRLFMQLQYFWLANYDQVLTACFPSFTQT